MRSSWCLPISKPGLAATPPPPHPSACLAFCLANNSTHLSLRQTAAPSPPTGDHRGREKERWPESSGGHFVTKPAILCQPCHLMLPSFPTIPCHHFPQSSACVRIYKTCMVSHSHWIEAHSSAQLRFCIETWTRLHPYKFLLQGSNDKNTPQGLLRN